MNSSHMKPLQLTLINVTENLTAYLAGLEEQNERTKKSHEKLCKTTAVEDCQNYFNLYLHHGKYLV